MPRGDEVGCESNVNHLPINFKEALKVKKYQVAMRWPVAVRLAFLHACDKTC
jgi:hypothetical protein